MDDGKRENNKVKRSKTDPVKTVVSVYLHRRQFPTLKKRKITKKFNIKRATLDTRIGRPNSVLFSCSGSSDSLGDSLLVEYNLMFQKFMCWLKDQTEYNKRCFDIEKLVGPLFCHFYLDILQNGYCQVEKASAFYLAHYEKVDKSKCDNIVKDLIIAIENNSDITKLSEKIRSSKVVAILTPKSLHLLQKFVSDSSHVVFLQVFQKWFDLRTHTNNNNISVKAEKPMHRSDLKEYKYEAVQSVIRKIKRLKIQWTNLEIKNNKNYVTCGTVRHQIGIVLFAESNILKIVPIHELQPPLNVETHQNSSQIKFYNHTQKIYCISVSPKYDFVCTGSADRTICIYNLKKVKLHLRVWGHSGPIYCTSISESGKYLVSGSQDATARLWNLENGKTLRIFAGHTNAVTCVDFHPNTLYVATGSSDRNIRVWCLKTGNPVRLFHATKGTIDCLAFDPSGLFLASASEDKKIRIWDLATSKTTHDFKYRDGMICRELLWDKKSRQLVGGFSNGLLKMWDIHYSKEHSREHSRHHTKEHSKEHSHHSKDHHISSKDRSRDHKKDHVSASREHREHCKEKDRDKEPNCVVRKVNGRILSLEYTMGVYGSLSVSA